MKKTCAYPGCQNVLYSGNRSGVCREHNHQKPYCKCVQCGGSAPRYRLKTVDELVDEGLLPSLEYKSEPDPSIRKMGRVSLIAEPWDKAS